MPGVKHSISCRMLEMFKIELTQVHLESVTLDTPLALTPYEFLLRNIEHLESRTDTPVDDKYFLKFYLKKLDILYIVY